MEEVEVEMEVEEEEVVEVEVEVEVWRRRRRFGGGGSVANSGAFAGGGMYKWKLIFASNLNNITLASNTKESPRLPATL